jgi:hypothetical protein
LIRIEVRPSLPRSPQRGWLPTPIEESKRDPEDEVRYPSDPAGNVLRPQIAPVELPLNAWHEYISINKEREHSDQRPNEQSPLQAEATQ